MSVKRITASIPAQPHPQPDQGVQVFTGIKVKEIKNKSGVNNGWCRFIAVGGKEFHGSINCTNLPKEFPYLTLSFRAKFSPKEGSWEIENGSDSFAYEPLTQGLLTSLYASVNPDKDAKADIQRIVSEMKKECPNLLFANPGAAMKQADTTHCILKQSCAAAHKDLHDLCLTHPYFSSIPGVEAAVRSLVPRNILSIMSPDEIAEFRGLVEYQTLLPFFDSGKIRCMERLSPDCMGIITKCMSMTFSSLERNLVWGYDVIKKKLQKDGADMISYSQACALVGKETVEGLTMNKYMCTSQREDPSSGYTRQDYFIMDTSTAMDNRVISNLVKTLCMERDVDPRVASLVLKLVKGEYSIGSHGRKFSRDQIVAIAKAVTSGFMLLEGPPGSGKSFTLAHILAIMQFIFKHRILVVSSTGKTSSNLRRELKRVGQQPLIIHNDDGTDTVIGSGDPIPSPVAPPHSKEEDDGDSDYGYSDLSDFSDVDDFEEVYASTEAAPAAKKIKLSEDVFTSDPDEDVEPSASITAIAPATPPTPAQPQETWMDKKRRKKVPSLLDAPEHVETQEEAEAREKKTLADKEQQIRELGRNWYVEWDEILRCKARVTTPSSLEEMREWFRTWTSRSAPKDLSEKMLELGKERAIKEDPELAGLGDLQGEDFFASAYGLSREDAPVEGSLNGLRRKAGQASSAAAKRSVSAAEQVALLDIELILEALQQMSGVTLETSGDQIDFSKPVVVCTIHAAVYRKRMAGKGNRARANPLEGFTMLAVDEAGQTPNSDLTDMITSIPNLPGIQNMLMVGDSRQMGSMEGPNLFYAVNQVLNETGTMKQINRNPWVSENYAMLQTNHRVAEGNRKIILQLLQDVREGESVRKIMDACAKEGSDAFRVITVSSREEWERAICSVNDAQPGVEYVAHTRATCDDINRVLLKKLYPQQSRVILERSNQKKNLTGIISGAKIMILQNFISMGFQFSNGELYSVERIYKLTKQQRRRGANTDKFPLSGWKEVETVENSEWNSCYAVLKEGKVISLKDTSFGSFTPGIVFTARKIQGSEHPSICMVFPHDPEDKSIYAMDNSLIYTVFSRAQQRVTVILPGGASRIDAAIARNNHANLKFNSLARELDFDGQRESHRRIPAILETIKTALFPPSN